MKNKSYLVIGGSSGIGLASASMLVQAGARVVIAGRDKARLDHAKKQLGAEVETRALEIAHEHAVIDLFKDMGELEGIVCTAGHSPPGEIAELSVVDAKAGFESKFFGQYFVVKYGISKLAATGSIVLTGGVYAVRPVKGVGILAAVNGAIDSFVRAMAVELAPRRINVLAPGLIQTQRFKQISGKDPQKLAQTLESKVPLRRVGTTEEAAVSVLYLLNNSYVTGTTLYIDGGLAQR